MTDTFSVNNPGGSTPPIICGTNTGEHSKLHTFVIMIHEVFITLQRFQVPIAFNYFRIGVILKLISYRFNPKKPPEVCLKIYKVVDFRILPNV